MAFFSEEVIQSNKQKFIELVSSIKRLQNASMLVSWLEEGDFFIAPASTQFHNSCKGGLCAHSLNVYDNLVMLYKNMISNTITEDVMDSLKIVALLHDVSKVGQYRETVKNKKVYSDVGSKSDNMGRFDWVSVPGYETRPASERLIYGNHEQNSEYLARCFIPLSIEESSAILHHMGGMAFDSAKDNIGDVFSKYPIALLLYMADMLSTYVNERE